VRNFLKYWVPLLTWMAVIFFASGDAASFNHSSRLIAPVVHWLFPGISPDALHSIVVIVRKTAHVTEYAILALLLWRCLRNTPGTHPSDWPHQTALRTLLFIILYASSDEFHQRFVPSRDASVRDVVIDTAGAAFALLLIWVVGRWRRRW
jgi:VanZ family protein